MTTLIKVKVLRPFLKEANEELWINPEAIDTLCQKDDLSYEIVMRSQIRYTIGFVEFEKLLKTTGNKNE